MTAAVCPDCGLPWSSGHHSGCPQQRPDHLSACWGARGGICLMSCLCPCHLPEAPDEARAIAYALTPAGDDYVEADPREAALGVLSPDLLEALRAEMPPGPYRMRREEAALDAGPIAVRLVSDSRDESALLAVAYATAWLPELLRAALALDRLAAALESDPRWEAEARTVRTSVIAPRIPRGG